MSLCRDDCQLYPDNMLASRDQKQRHYMHVCVIDHDKREMNRKVENVIQDLKMRAQMGISSTGLLYVEDAMNFQNTTPRIN